MRSGNFQRFGWLPRGNDVTHLTSEETDDEFEPMSSPTYIATAVANGGAGGTCTILAAAVIYRRIYTQSTWSTWFYCL